MTEVDEVVALCDEALESLDSPEARDAVKAVRSRLKEPLRLAVVGRVSSGKSTLVNALLGQRLAPTKAGECTNVVAWFRYDSRPRVELVFSDQRPLEERPLTSGLGTSAEEAASLDHIDVYLTSRALKHLTIIDTPGLAGFNTVASDRTKVALAMHDASRSAAAEADVLLLVLDQTAHATDVDVLDAFSSLLGKERSMSIVTAVGVLNKADLVADGDVAQAAEIADRLYSELRRHVATILPLDALYAQSANILSEKDARQLRQLARLDAQIRSEMLSDVDEFRDMELPVLQSDMELPVLQSDRKRLLEEMLGLHGVRRCLDLVDAGRIGAAALRTELEKASGIASLRDAIHELFVRHADLLRASGALAELGRLASATDREAAAGMVLGAAVERVAASPRMRRVRAIRALQDVAAGTLPPLEEELEDDLVRVATADSPAARVGLAEGARARDVRAAAIQRAGRWRRLKNDFSKDRGQRQVAEILCQSYETLASELKLGGNGEVARAN